MPSSCSYLSTFNRPRWEKQEICMNISSRRALSKNERNYEQGKYASF
jgi:hypothetical protein